MTETLIPWLEASLVVLLVGTVWVSRVRSADAARRWTVVFTGAVMAGTLGLWTDFLVRGPECATTLLKEYLGSDFLVVEELNGPLIVLAAFLYLLVAVATPRPRPRHFSFAWMLASEAILLATLGCQKPWGVVALLAAGAVPPYLELRAGNKPTRVYLLHMGLFVGLLVCGWVFFEVQEVGSANRWLPVLPLLGAVFIRSGIAPFHCWVTDLFEHASFETALLFVAPMAGAFAAVRLVLPIAPDWALRGIGLLALATAVYAAGMALVQSEGRRFFCYVFLSHAALVLVGMDTIASGGGVGGGTDGVIGLTGGLCVWLSVALALAGFGLTLYALEARHGRLSLIRYHGLYDYTPTLAICFLLTGLASLGFPGTFGFLGTEMLVDGAVEAYAYVGVVVVAVAALNGVAIVKAYFLLFTGTRPVTTVPLGIGPRERAAVLTLSALILLGGLFPQPGVLSRYKAALDLLEQRRRALGGPEASTPAAAGRDGSVVRSGTGAAP